MESLLQLLRMVITRLEELLALLMKHDGPVLFIGKDTALHEEEITEATWRKCGYCTISL